MFWTNFDLVPEDLVLLCQLADCFHKLVPVALIRGCNQYNVIERGGYARGMDHSAHAVISCISYTQLLVELEIVIFVHKKNLEPKPRSFEEFVFHSLQISMYIPESKNA